MYGRAPGSPPSGWSPRIWGRCAPSPSWCCERRSASSGGSWIRGRGSSAWRRGRRDATAPRAARTRPPPTPPAPSRRMRWQTGSDRTRRRRQESPRRRGAWPRLPEWHRTVVSGFEPRPQATGVGVKNPVAEAVDRGDLDELVRLVDGLCSAREWASVVDLRDRCRHALERGLQLWPAAEYAEYRLALEAPAGFAGPVVTEQAGRFALGPLWEVAASTHDWAALSPHLPPGPARSLAAQERVLRGEDLTGDPSIDTGVLDVPLVLLPWEPSSPWATYRSSRAESPPPPPVPLRRMAPPAGWSAASDPAGVEARLAGAPPR